MQKARRKIVVAASIGILASIATTHAATAANPEPSTPTVVSLRHMPAASQAPAAHSAAIALHTASLAVKDASDTSSGMHEDECIMLGGRPL